MLIGVRSADSYISPQGELMYESALRLRRSQKDISVGAHEALHSADTCSIMFSINCTIRKSY